MKIDEIRELAAIMNETGLTAIEIEESEPPVESEICRATVNYTDVAPFGEPVTGGEN